MNTLVKFELAKLLKEKRFDKPINSFYTDTGKLWKQRKQIPTANYNAYPKNPNSKLFYKYGYSAPTIAKVVMWLYEKHGIWIAVTQELGYTTTFCYQIMGEHISATYKPYFKTPTKAYEAAIEFTLENLI